MQFLWQLLLLFVLVITPGGYGGRGAAVERGGEGLLRTTGSLKALDQFAIDAADATTQPGVGSGGVVDRVNSYPEAVKESPIQQRLVLNQVIAWLRQDNRLQDAIYRQLDHYANMQARVRNPRFAASLEAGLADPEYQVLQNTVRDPRYADTLQRGMLRNAGEYQQMVRTVSDPAYVANGQAKAYVSWNRPGPQDYVWLSNRATKVELSNGGRGQ